MSSLIIEGVRKKFGAQEVLRGLSLEVPSGSFFSLLGPSGCGKSTLLRIVAGLEKPDSGSVILDGLDLANTPPQERGIGMVFQQYALWPHMSVDENLRFGLRCQGLPRSEQDARVNDCLRLVRMAEYAHRYPHEISGGQQQRVAVARALALRPKLLLMDEPLSNLDARLRAEIRDELRVLHAHLGITIVYVTHDQEDALSLASSVALLREGQIEQVGSPVDMYRRPLTPFSATFLGDANLLPVTVSSGPTVTLRGQQAHSLPYVGPQTRAGEALLCIRPEFVQVRQESDGGCLTGRVVASTFLGASHDLHVEVGAGVNVRAKLSSTGALAQPTVGTTVCLSWAPEDAALLSE